MGLSLLTSGIRCCLQRGGVRTESRCRTSSWCRGMAWHGENSHQLASEALIVQKSRGDARALCVPPSGCSASPRQTPALAFPLSHRSPFTDGWAFSRPCRELQYRPDCDLCKARSLELAHIGLLKSVCCHSKMYHHR